MADSLDLEKMTLEAEALNFMAQGKRHLLVHDYNSAVQCLEEACKLFDEKYGINADESAEAYLKYGHALLELHRQETGALDGLVDPKESGETDAEDEDEEEEEEELDDEEKNDEKQQETNVENGNKLSAEVNEEDISVSPTPPVDQSQQASNGISAATTSPSTNGNSSANVILEEKPSSSNNEMETDPADPNQPSTSNGITDENRVEEEEESSPSNIEVAFEVLTMAKDIFKRQITYRDDVHLKLADALQKLGEILYEWENNEEALNELNECLEIRKRHLPDDDRLIAETYYHIGLTYSLSSKVDEANTNFQKAVDVIEERLTRLKSSYTDEQNAEKREKIEIEIKELELVLPEMKSKIEDSQDQMSTLKLATVNEESEKLEEEKIAEKKKQILAKPISNVTHLVKRKREEPSEPEVSNKKLKNGVENGNGQSENNNVEMNI